MLGRPASVAQVLPPSLSLNLQGRPLPLAEMHSHLASVVAPGLSLRARPSRAADGQAGDGVHTWAAAAAEMLMREANSDESDDGGGRARRVALDTVTTWAGRTDTSLRRAAVTGEWEAAAGDFLSESDSERDAPPGRRKHHPAVRQRAINSPILSSVSSGVSENDRDRDSDRDSDSDGNRDRDISRVREALRSDKQSGVVARQRRLKRLQRGGDGAEMRGSHRGIDGRSALMADALAEDSGDSMVSRERDANFTYRERLRKSPASPRTTRERKTPDKSLGACLDKMSEVIATLAERQTASSGQDHGMAGALSRIIAEVEDLRRDVIGSQTMLRTQSAMDTDRSTQTGTSAHQQTDQARVAAGRGPMAAASEVEAAAEVVSLRRAIADAEDETQKLRRAMAEAEADRHNLRRAAAEAEDEKQSLRRVASESEDQRQSLHKKLDVVERQLREAKTGQLAAEALAAQREIDQVRSDSEKERLQNQIAALEHENKRIAVLEDQVRAAQSTYTEAVSTAQAYRADSESEKLRLRERVATLESQVGAAQADAARVGRVREAELAQCRDLESSKITALELQLEQVRTLAASQADARVQEIQRVADMSIDEARHDMELVMAEHERSIAQLRATTQMEGKRDREAAARADSRANEALAELAQCREMIQATEVELAARDSSLEAIRQDCRAQVAAKSSALHAAEARAASLQRLLVAEQEEASTAKSTVREQQAQLAEVRQQLQQGEQAHDEAAKIASEALAAAQATAEERCNHVAAQSKRALDEAESAVSALRADLDRQREAQTFADETAAAARIHAEEQLARVEDDANKRVAQAQAIQVEEVRKLKHNLETQLSRIEEQANARIESAERAAAEAEAQRVRADHSAVEMAEENRKLQLALKRVSTDDDTRLREAEALADQYHAELQRSEQDAASSVALAAEQLRALEAAAEATKRSSDEKLESLRQALETERKNHAATENAKETAHADLKTALETHRIELEKLVADLEQAHKVEKDNLARRITQQEEDRLEHGKLVATLELRVSELDKAAVLASELASAQLATVEEQLQAAEAAKQALEETMSRQVKAIQREADEKLLHELKIAQDNADAAVREANNKVKEMAAQCSKRVSETQQQAEELVKSSVRKAREHAQAQIEKEKEIADAEARASAAVEIAHAKRNAATAAEAMQAAESSHTESMTRAAEAAEAELEHLTAELTEARMQGVSLSEELKAVKSVVSEMEAAAESNSAQLYSIKLELAASEEVSTLSESAGRRLMAALSKNEQDAEKIENLQKSLDAALSELEVATSIVVQTSDLDIAGTNEGTHLQIGELQLPGEPLRTVSSIPTEQSITGQQSALQTQLSVELQDTHAQLQRELYELAAVEVQRHVRGAQIRKRVVAELEGRVEQQKLMLEEQRRQQQQQHGLEESVKAVSQISAADYGESLGHLSTAAVDEALAAADGMSTILGEVDGTVYATLRCRDDQQPWAYHLRKTHTVLGRTLKGEQVSDCEVGAGKFISREHAVIVCDTSCTPHKLTLQCICTGKAWVTPLGRRSETVELTQHDEPHELHDDDEIRIGRAAGDVSMIIQIPDSDLHTAARARKSPIPEVEEFVFEQTGPLGIVFGESKFPENRLDAASPLMTVVDQVKGDSMAARLYAQLLDPLDPNYERIVSHVNGVDVAAVGFDETLRLIKGPRPLVVRTVIRKRPPLDNSAGEYAELLADGSILSLNTPLASVAEETLSDLGASPNPRDSAETAAVTQSDTPDHVPESITAHPTPEMVREMAQYLGIDEQQEVHLLPIAHSALVEELPDGWEERLSPTDGVPYYVELATGRVSGEHPADDHYRQLLAHFRTTSPANAADDFHGEMEFFDPDAQQHYTYNFKTGRAYRGSVMDQQAVQSPDTPAINALPVLLPAFARLPDAAVGHTPAIGANRNPSENMLGLTPTKLLESSSGAKKLFPSSPGETSAYVTAARENSPDIHQFDRSMSADDERETAETANIQIQAHNRALNEFNQLQRQARKEAAAAVRDRAKHRLKHVGIDVIKFAARNSKPASKLLMLSQDTKYLQWGDTTERLSTRVELKSIERVEYGDIQVSQRAASKHAMVATAFSEPWQTFFLWDGKRSYDFYIPDGSGGTGATVQTLVAINAARGLKGHPTRVGQFLWKAARMRLRMRALDEHGTDSIAARRLVLADVLYNVSPLSKVQRSQHPRGRT